MWSIKAIQDLIIEDEKWEKKNLYATDSEKCARGLFYSIKGEEPTNPIDPRGKRRMEVGQMVERNQVEKLKSLGILIEAQRRIYDEEGNVSGRHDGIVISPEQCTPRAKEFIEEKKKIYQDIKFLDKAYYATLEDYNSDVINKEELMSNLTHLISSKTDLYDRDKEINKELLIPDPDNHLIVMEIKSIVEMGFKYRIKENKPMDSHTKQLIFYLWKLRETYPNIEGRVIYVDTSYQNILEFTVDVDPLLLEDMKRFWRDMNGFINNDKLPPCPSDVVINPLTGKYQVNYVAEWCNYHIKCTGDPNWLEKAKDKVKELNGTRKTNSSN